MAMDKNFTEKQREIVARKMGYEGPMSMFDTYLKSSPAEEQKYATIGQKFMAKGGVATNKKPRKLFLGSFLNSLNRSEDSSDGTSSSRSDPSPEKCRKKDFFSSS